MDWYDAIAYRAVEARILREAVSRAYDYADEHHTDRREAVVEELVDLRYRLHDDQPDGEDPTEIVRLADGRLVIELPGGEGATRFEIVE